MAQGTPGLALLVCRRRRRRAAEPLYGLMQTVLSQHNTSMITGQQFAALKATYPVWEAGLSDGPNSTEAVLKAAGCGHEHGELMPESSSKSSP